MLILEPVPLQGLGIGVDHDGLLATLVGEAGQPLVQLLGEKGQEGVEQFEGGDEGGVEEEEGGQEAGMGGGLEALFDILHVDVADVVVEKCTQCSSHVMEVSIFKVLVNAGIIIIILKNSINKKNK
jgi:hypothetical protein